MKTIQDAAKSGWFWAGLVVSVCTLSAGIVKSAGYAKAEELRGYAKVDALHKVELEQARQAGVVQGMADRVGAIFEMQRAEYYRLHRVIIPDPAASVDGGVR